ncbi:MAG: hypothetical protein EOP48_01060 [Sphingobacteriales bacterium]|nr:MAG: hypothetical protein EOP48_01060 [Sphingobacteriales bacterium]
MAPEIVKKRPVLVIHSHKSNSKLVTVIPISATSPTKIEYYHYELNLTIEKNVEPYLSNRKRWFKCDLVYVVSIERMDQLKHRDTGKRSTPQVSMETIRIVKDMARRANGL